MSEQVPSQATVTIGVFTDSMSGLRATGTDGLMYLVTPSVEIERGVWLDVLFIEQQGYRWITEVVGSAEGRYKWDSRIEHFINGADVCVSQTQRMTKGSIHWVNLTEQGLITAGAPEEVLSEHRALLESHVKKAMIEQYLEEACSYANMRKLAEAYIEFRGWELPRDLIRKFTVPGLVSVLVVAGLRAMNGHENYGITLERVFSSMKDATDLKQNSEMRQTLTADYYCTRDVIKALQAIKPVRKKASEKKAA